MGLRNERSCKTVTPFKRRIIGRNQMMNGCVKDCMGKKLEDDVEKDIEDCEILEDHLNGDRGNRYHDEDNAGCFNNAHRLTSLIGSLVLVLDYVDPQITDEKNAGAIEMPKGILSVFSVIAQYICGRLFSNDTDLSYYGNVKRNYSPYTMPLKDEPKNVPV
ncbi:hypothetical protein Tco_1530881 [Tanacetum coccineum]